MDLAVTPTGVLPTANTNVNRSAVWGETVTAGQAVYRKAADRRWWKAKANGTAEEAGSGGLGIAMGGGAAGQPAAVATAGDVTIAATVVNGMVYVISATAGGGGIAPFADLIAGQRVSLVGYGKPTGLIQLDANATGIVRG
jgi:hypothetical protein